MRRIVHIFSIVLIIGLVSVAFSSLLPKEISGLDAPATQFSTARAMQHLEVIAKEPHFVGTKAHTEVRAYIVKELEKLGLETQVQEGFTFDQWRGYGNLVKPQNILARIKGSENGKALMLMSHYDSAPHSSSHGASDAGSGVVTILESVRAYLASGTTPKNDIIICITDSEELGLDGASLFVNEHPWAKNVGVALNFEARGSGGPSNMIVETNGGNANLIKGFMDADVKYPVATSLMYSIYKMLPNDTDSTILREDGDIDGFFFAFIDDHYDYHTINDTAENLDENSLEHQGSYLMPLLKYYADADLSSVKSSEDYVYFDTAVATFIAYPFSWIWPMLILAIVLFVVVIAYGFKKKRLYKKAISKGFGAFMLSLILGGGLLYLLWGLIKILYPSYNEILPVFIYNGHWYTIAFVLLGVSLCFGIYHKMVKAEHTASTLVAPLTIWLIINIALALKLQGAAFFIIPVYFGLLALFLLIRQTNPSVTLMVLLSAPAIFLFAPLVQFFPVGLGPDMLYVSVIFTVLLFGLLIPVFGFFRNKKIVGVLSLLTAFIFLGVAHAKSSSSPERQQPNSLLYYHNADTNKAYWATYAQHIDDWTRGYLGDNPEPATKYIGNAAGSKYNTPYSYAKETAVINLPESEIRVSQDTVIGTIAYTTMTIVPKRNVHQMRLYSPIGTPFQYLSYNGKEFKPDSTETLYKKRGSKGMLSYYLTQGDSLEVTYGAPEGVMPTFTLKEFSYDLLDNPSFTVSARPKNTKPEPFIANDAVVVERTIDVSAFAKTKTDTLAIDQTVIEE
ncbi:aminopeptidase [Dokdonia pacifica]|uniref:Vacuolar membrane protease n=1 Tax=Dokdonia pacifica TaxID=1627892 RepID=A0A238W9L0_9FLAO|nr:M28 family peptidase [Dokdonia pacifica]GGG13818.1 aminopeptidase [Dokdonia pacifica]SNR43220.1 Peptidase family M28 [Dokdonia pacifica]